MIQVITLEEDEELDYDSMDRNGSIDESVMESVRAILADVKERGDEAVSEYSVKFDKVKLKNFRVPDEMVENSDRYLEAKVSLALEDAAESIRAFHEGDIPRSTFKMREDGSMVGYKVSPLKTVGLYVPGGRASYPSTVLMNGIPASMAGVDRLVMVTPPSSKGSIDPALLYAAKLAGVDDVYAVGGAQAIAALAYGTETIPKVDKIVGPGNVFVAAAKSLVSGTVGIDLQAGPTEVLVMADETSDPRLVAADLISQAEHDPNASCYLVTVGDAIVEDVIKYMDEMIEEAPRKEIMRESIDNNGLIVVCPNVQSAVDTANGIAPEHLQVMMKNPMELVGKINNAGAVFVGKWSPVAIGDYIAGPSHTLPTSGTARFSNPLTTDDFVKKTSVIFYTEESIMRDAEAVVAIADSEGFRGHAVSVEERVKIIEEAAKDQNSED